jgi:hypothetical protein
MTHSNRTIIAAVLVFLFSLISLIRGFLDFVNQGPILQNADRWFIVLGFMLFTILLVSSYGIWKNQRWGMIAAIAILTLNALAVLPQILEGGTLADQVPRLIDVGVWLVATVLLLWPNRNAVPRETESSAQ